MNKQKVVLTDHPWPDVHIEQSIFDAAGIELVSGPIEAQGAAVIDAMIRRHQPQGVMCCWSPVSSQAIESVRELKVVARLGVGLDNIAVTTATERGVWVTNVPDYCVEEVSDHAIAMLLASWRGINAFDREAKLGRWNPASADLRRVSTMTVGIIGFGRIGQATARKLSRGFKSKVLVYSRSLLKAHRDGEEIEPGISVASVETMQARADAIVLHLPLTDESQRMIDAKFLARLQRKPLLVNVSRGGLIDTAAVVRALDDGALLGAALDVLDGEPNPSREVMNRPDIIVTPHIAFTSDASLLELRQRCSADVVRVLRGEAPRHPCNSPRR